MASADDFSTSSGTEPAGQAHLAAQQDDPVAHENAAPDGPPATAGGQDGHADDAGGGEPGDAGAPAKEAKKKTRRSKRGGSGSSKSGKAKAAGKDAKAGQPDEGAPDAAAAQEDPAAPAGAWALADDPAAPAAAPVTAFGLLFQAPDPAAVPRRRPRAEEEDPGEPGDADADETDADEDSADGGDEGTGPGRRRRRRGGRGRRRGSADAAEDSEDASPGDDAGPDEAGTPSPEDEPPAGSGDDADDSAAGEEDSTGSRRRTRRRRRSGTGQDASDDPPGTVTRVREPRRERDNDTATGIKGSTRLEAKRQRRRDGREAGRRRTIITEAQFLARRESVERVMAIRQIEGRTEIGVLEDGVLVEHYISGADGGSGGTSGATSVGNVYLGRVQNVLPSMEAAFVDIGKGRNAVLYAGEVNWDAAGLEANSSRRIENALTSGQSVLVQVTKDPIGHKGARLTSQVSLPGRFLVYVPDGSMTGISRKLPDNERARLKSLLKKIVPPDAGVIVRTAAEGASEEELRADVERLERQWERIQKKAKSASAPALLHGEPGLTVRVVRDVFNEDFAKLVVAGSTVWDTVSDYVDSVAPDLRDRVEKWTGTVDLFSSYRIDEQLAKAMDRKVWLPSGGSLIIDRTEAMTVIDVNTGKFTGSGGNLEETVTKNNLEAAEEIVRQLRLRDIGGIIVVDFIDMVLESNRDLVVRRLVECLGRDRTKHQVAEVTSLGLVQMTRKRVGAGLIEVFSQPCEHCHGRGIIVHDTPHLPAVPGDEPGEGKRGRRGKDNGRARSESGRAGKRARAAEEEYPAGPGDGGGQSAAQMAARVAAARRSEEAGDGDGGPDQAAGAPEDPAAGTAQRAGDAGQDGGEAAGQDGGSSRPARRGRRGSRRAASSPSGGPSLSSAGLMTASAPDPAAASLTQVAGDASVGDSGTGVSADLTGEHGGQPAQAAGGSRRARRQAASPAGPPEHAGTPGGAADPAQPDTGGEEPAGPGAAEPAQPQLPGVSQAPGEPAGDPGDEAAAPGAEPGEAPGNPEGS